MEKVISSNFNNFIGEFESDTTAINYIKSGKWDSNGDGTGGVDYGVVYYNSTTKKLRCFDGTNWGNCINMIVSLEDNSTSWELKVDANGKLKSKNTATGVEVVHIAENLPSSPNSTLYIHKILRDDGLEQSPSGMLLKWTNVGRTQNKWLKGGEGIPSNITGELIFKDAYLVSVSVISKQEASYDIKICADNDYNNWLAELAIESARKASFTGLNIAVDAGSELQCFLSGAATYPTVVAELLWR